MLSLGAFGKKKPILNPPKIQAFSNVLKPSKRAPLALGFIGFQHLGCGLFLLFVATFACFCVKSTL